MTKREKLRRKLRNPSADANMRDVQTLLGNFGFVLIRTRGSHHIFEYDDGERNEQVVFPVHGRKVKRVYIKDVVKILDELFPVEEVDDTEEDEND
jgi:predicted RNA binding protein YcfA (HicA-like mRNA interferase family)